MIVWRAAAPRAAAQPQRGIGAYLSGIHIQESRCLCPAQAVTIGAVRTL